MKGGLELAPWRAVARPPGPRPRTRRSRCWRRAGRVLDARARCAGRAPRTHVAAPRRAGPALLVLVDELAELSAEGAVALLERLARLGRGGGDRGWWGGHTAAVSGGAGRSWTRATQMTVAYSRSASIEARDGRADPRARAGWAPAGGAERLKRPRVLPRGWRPAGTSCHGQRRAPFLAGPTTLVRAAAGRRAAPGRSSARLCVGGGRPRRPEGAVLTAREPRRGARGSRPGRGRGAPGDPRTRRRRGGLFGRRAGGLGVGRSRAWVFMRLSVHEGGPAGFAKLRRGRWRRRSADRGGRAGGARDAATAVRQPASPSVLDCRCAADRAGTHTQRLDSPAARQRVAGRPEDAERHVQWAPPAFSSGHYRLSAEP